MILPDRSSVRTTDLVSAVVSAREERAAEERVERELQRLLPESELMDGIMWRSAESRPPEPLPERPVGAPAPEPDANRRLLSSPVQSRVLRKRPSSRPRPAGRGDLPQGRLSRVMRGERTTNVNLRQWGF
jgi:hypothetical protein